MSARTSSLNGDYTKADFHPLIDVFALVRISDAGGAADDKFGGPRQLAAIEVARQAHGLNIVKTFIVTDVSGRHAEEDRDFQEIFAGLRSKIARGLVVAEQSRIFRPDGMRQYGILAHFQENDARIFTPTGVIDLNTTEGRISTVVTGLMSGEELHKIRERCNGAKQKRREAGRHAGGNQILPRGVKYVRERNDNGRVIKESWTHDGVDSERMRIAYELLVRENLPYEWIAERIGGGYSGHGVKESLMNPVWKGYRLYTHEAKGTEYIPPKGKPDKNGKIKPRRHMTLKPEPLLVKIDLPSIVSDEVWARAQEIIAQRETSHRKLRLKNAGRPRHLAAGIGYCSCGQTLYTRYGGRGSHLDTYYCATQDSHKGAGGIRAGCGMKALKRDEVDAAIETMITTNLLTSDYVIETVELVAEPAADPGRVQREAALRDVRRKRAILLEDRLDGTIAKDRFVARDRELETEERSLQTLLPMPKPKAKPVDLGERIARVFAEFAFLSFAKKRSLLQRAVREIILDGRTIPSLILRGGFLNGANSPLQSTSQCPIHSLSDVVIRFPKPIEIKDTFVDGRKRTGGNKRKRSVA